MSPLLFPIAVLILIMTVTLAQKCAETFADAEPSIRFLIPYPPGTKGKTQVVICSTKIERWYYLIRSSAKNSFDIFNDRKCAEELPLD